MLGYKSAKFLPINFIGISPNSVVKRNCPVVANGKIIDNARVDCNK